MAGKHRRPAPPKNSVREGSRQKTWWFAVPVAVLLVGTGVYYAMTRPLNASNQGVAPLTLAKTNFDVGRVNVLLIGTDTRPGQSGGNTDVLILCSIDNPNHRVELLSIPRDTKVLYPDGSYAKINESLNIGGPQLTVNLVQKLLNIPVDHYALTHFGGLVDVINTIGGITVDVPERMYYNTGDKTWNIINLRSGVQTLNGPEALGFVRFRNDALGDIGRTMRQQAFLQALFHKLLQPQNITKLPRLVSEMSKTVNTNMNLADIAGLASTATQFKNYKVIHETLPGSFENPSATNPISYWLVNPAQAQFAARQFLYHGVVQKNPVQDATFTENWTAPAVPTSANTSIVSANSTTVQNSTSSTNTGANAVNDTTGSGSSTTQNSTQGSTVSATTPTVTQPGTSRTVAVASAFIRSGPGTGYSVLASVLQNQTVWVVGQSGNWDEVEVKNGQYGYIADWLLQPSN